MAWKILVCSEILGPEWLVRMACGNPYVACRIHVASTMVAVVVPEIFIFDEARSSLIRILHQAVCTVVVGGQVVLVTNG